jgi:hypothetical protein
MPARFPAFADILAGESAAEDIDFSQVVLSRFGESAFGAAAFADVVKLASMRKMAREHAPAIGVDFNLPDRFDSRALEAKIKPSNPRKKTAMR